MVMMVTVISIWQRTGKRRKLLQALSTGEKTLGELTAISEFCGGKQYVCQLLGGLRKLGYVKSYGHGRNVLYVITDRGKRFLRKENIGEVI